MPHAAGLYYEWHGAGGREPVILSSGLGGSASYWAPNLPALADHHHILVYDHRGTGRSDRNLPDIVTVEHLAEDIIGLMDALEIPKAHLVGHAAGGVAGLSLALSAPARLTTLTVINAWPGPDPYFARCFDARLSLLRLAGPEAYLRAQPIFLYTPDWCSSHHDEIEAELPHQLASFPDIATMEKRIAALRNFDITDRLGEIALPVLVVCGAQDTLVPSRCSSRLAAGIPHAWSQFFSLEGHACNVTGAFDFEDLFLNFIGG